MAQELEEAASSEFSQASFSGNSGCQYGQMLYMVSIKCWSCFDTGSPRSGKEIKARAYIQGYKVLGKNLGTRLRLTYIHVRGTKLWLPCGCWLMYLCKALQQLCKHYIGILLEPSGQIRYVHQPLRRRCKLWFLCSGMFGKYCSVPSLNQVASSNIHSWVPIYTTQSGHNVNYLQYTFINYLQYTIWSQC